MSLNLNYKPEAVVEISGLSREEWLDYRKKGIGGSDAAAIMGVSPFATKRDLFYDKTGIRPAFQENEDNWVAKEVGHRLEDLVAEIFSQKTGLKIFPVRTMFRHPLYPFMLADVDFFIEFADGTYGILECKTTNYNCQEKWANNTIPVNYEYQVRHYMSVMNIDKAYIACLYGNNAEEFFIRPLERDLETEEDLIAEEKYFWEEKVLKKVEPDYVEKADLVIASIKKHYGPAGRRCHSFHKESIRDQDVSEPEAGKSEAGRRGKASGGENEAVLSWRTGRIRSKLQRHNHGWHHKV